MLISIAGIDGSGKSSQIARLHKWLLTDGIGSFSAKADLYATKSFMSLSERMVGDRFAYHPIIPATLREFVVACDIYQYFETIIQPRMREGKLVIWDRGPLCYRSYLVAYGAEDVWPKRILEMIPEPDLTILLDCPAEIAVKRIQVRNGGAVQGDEDLDLLTAVRRRYLECMGEFRNVRVIDATMSADDVSARIHALVSEARTDVGQS